MLVLKCGWKKRCAGTISPGTILPKRRMWDSLERSLKVIEGIDAMKVPYVVTPGMASRICKSRCVPLFGKELARTGGIMRYSPRSDVSLFSVRGTCFDSAEALRKTAMFFALFIVLYFNSSIE